MFDMTALLGFAFRKQPIHCFSRSAGALWRVRGGTKLQRHSRGVRQLYAPYNGLAAQSFVWLDTHRDSIGSLFLSERDGCKSRMTVTVRTRCVGSYLPER